MKIILVFILFITLIAQAQPDASNKLINPVTLTIKPHICVAPRGESSCISTIDVSWESLYIGDFCLDTDVTSDKLACWQSKKKGYYQHKLIFDKNITYFIKDSLSNQEIVSAIMKFRSLKPNRKLNKRRNRFPWSLGSP